MKFKDHGTVSFHKAYQGVESRSLRESKQAELPRAGVLQEMGQGTQKCPFRDFVEDSQQKLGGDLHGEVGRKVTPGGPSKMFRYLSVLATPTCTASR